MYLKEQQKSAGNPENICDHVTRVTKMN